MTLLKRLFLLIVFVVFAAGTRMIVRFGVQGTVDAILSAVGMQDRKLDVAKDGEKPPKKPKKGTSSTQIPIIGQGGAQSTGQQAGGAAPSPSSSPALGPSAPSIVGPINAARQVAAASNKQLTEQTGQETAPVKGGRQTGPAAQAPSNQPAAGKPAQAPSNQPPSNQPAASQPAANQPAVVQQGAPSAAPPGAPPASAPSAPAASDKKGAAPKAPPVDTKLAAMPAVRAGPPDTARAPVMRESFDYARDSRRDPFISLMTTSDLRPTITDLRLTGILYDLSGRRPVAILRDVAGGQWRVTTGMTLGRMRVAQIKPKVLVFTIEEFGFNRQDSLILGDTSRVRRR